MFQFDHRMMSFGSMGGSQRNHHSVIGSCPRHHSFVTEIGNLEARLLDALGPQWAQAYELCGPIVYLYFPIIPGVNLHFSANPCVTPIQDSSASLTLYQSIVCLYVRLRIPVFVGTSLSLILISNVPTSVPVQSPLLTLISSSVKKSILSRPRGPLVIHYDSKQISNSIRHLFYMTTQTEFAIAHRVY